MRHDIRTPLSGLVGAADLLKTATPEQIPEYSDWIIQSGQELLNFLNSILESVNVNSGDIPLVFDRFSLRATVESVVFLHKAKALEKGLKLSFNFDSAIPEYLIGDPVRIYRILLELLSNALKFTAKGFVAVRTTLVNRTERDLVIEIAIEDTGIGIPKDKQQDLLKRFNRVIASYEGIHKGSGLGLNIAKRFIDDLKAEIYIDSELGRGTKFSCLLPLREAL
jgi:signal transduction histidine kinase